MTADRPADGTRRPFGADELPAEGVQPDELAADVRLGRELEGLTARLPIRPTSDFSDRVMAAIDTEPVPAPAIAAGSALRRRSAGLFVASLRDAFRVAFGAGFPLVARGQALAIVLVIVVGVAGSGIAAASAVGLFEQRGTPTPSPSLPEPSLTPAPSVSPVPSPSVSPSPSTSPEPTETAEPSETPEPAETEPAATGPAATDDHGGGSGSDSGSGSGSGSGNSGPGGGSDPSATDDHGGDRTPRATETPKPTGEDNSGHG